MLPVESVYRQPTDSDGISPQGEPCRLWSLWDMLQNLYLLAMFRERVSTYQRTFRDFAIGPFGSHTTSDKLHDQIIHVVQTEIVADGISLLKGDGFKHSLLVLDKIAGRVLIMDYRELDSRLGELEENFRKDCTERWVFVLPEGHQGIYEKGLGRELTSVFPNANAETLEANRCYALGLNTACVFHLMRAVEHAMRGIAIAVGSTNPPPKIPLESQVWQTVIDGIESRTKDAANTWPEPAKAHGRAFFKGTVADLHAFKDETRNVLMHTRGEMYDGPGALSVRNRVAAFFKRLIGKVDEDGTQTLLNPSLFA